MSGLPGVEGAGVSSRLPLASSGSVLQQVQVDGGPAADDPREPPLALLRVASPGYFDAMRLRLFGGHLLMRRGGTGAPRVLVVNETFAREVLGGALAVGRRARFLNADSDLEPWEVVGVVADVTYGGLAVTEVRAGAGREPSPRYSRSTPLPCSSNDRPWSWPGPPAIRSPRSRSCARRWPRRAPARRWRR